MSWPSSCRATKAPNRRWRMSRRPTTTAAKEQGFLQVRSKKTWRSRQTRLRSILTLRHGTRDVTMKHKTFFWFILPSLAAMLVVHRRCRWSRWSCSRCMLNTNRSWSQTENCGPLRLHRGNQRRHCRPPPSCAMRAPARPVQRAGIPISTAATWPVRKLPPPGPSATSLGRFLR